jgi:hypothetical protein
MTSDTRVAICGKPKSIARRITNALPADSEVTANT